MTSDASFLDDLRIASPCKASWDAMEGDAQVRFCGICQKNVYDVREMTRDAAESLIKNRGEACVRMARRADGTVITSDCPVGARDKAKRQRTAALVGGGLLAASALLWKVRADATPTKPLRLHHVVDDIQLADHSSAPGAGSAKPVEPDQPVEVLMGDVEMPEPKVQPPEPDPVMGKVMVQPQPPTPATAHPRAPQKIR